MDKKKRRLQELAGIINESEKRDLTNEEQFTILEFESDLEINSDNNDLFQELQDSPKEDLKT